MDESDIKNMSDDEIRSAIVSWGFYQFQDNLDEKFWIEKLIKMFMDISDGDDKDFHFWYEIHAEFGYRTLADKFGIRAADNSTEYWKALCTGVVREYVPAYKIGYKGGRPTEEKKRLLVIGRLERIRKFKQCTIKEAAVLYVRRLKESTVRSLQSQFSVRKKIARMILWQHSSVSQETHMTLEGIETMVLETAVEKAELVDGMSPDYLK